jgi:hypothetical protein
MLNQSLCERISRAPACYLALSPVLFGLEETTKFSILHLLHGFEEGLDIHLRHTVTVT